MTESSESGDAIHRSSLKEFWWILLIWGGCFTWTISYCGTFGYETGETLSLTLGIPSWVFWGVFVPWGIATGVSCWFALTQMQDHPLESDLPSNDQSNGQASNELKRAEERPEAGDA